MGDKFSKPGLIGFAYKEKNDTNDWPSGDFHYRYVGRVGDRDIIFAAYWTGGSGQFSSLVSLRRKTANTFEFSDMAAGDRCSGYISSAKIVDGHVDYDQSQTPSDMMQLGLTPRDEAYDGLDYSAVSCVADAHMRDEKLVSLSLHQGDSPINPYKPQACFDKVYRNFVERRETELDAAKLDAFRSEFKSCIARG